MPPSARWEAAVEAVVAIVAHQEDMAGAAPSYRREIVGRAVVDLVEHGVARPAGQGLAIGRIEAVGRWPAADATNGVAGGTTLHGLLALTGI